jgi:hypothetical protein
MNRVGGKQTNLKIFSFRNTEENISKLPPRFSKYSLKTTTHRPSAFLISQNSKFGVLTSKLIGQIDSAHAKVITKFHAKSLLLLESIGFLTLNLVIFVKQSRLSHNYTISCIHSND